MIDLNTPLATPPQAPPRVEGLSGLAIQYRMAERMIGTKEFRESVTSKGYFFL